MKFFLILFTFFYSFSQEKLKVSKLTAYHYSTKDSISDWSPAIGCNINITVDSSDVHIYADKEEWLGVAIITELEDSRLKLECTNLEGYLIDVYIKNDRGLVFLTVDYYDHFITYYCKPSKNE